MSFTKGERLTFTKLNDALAANLTAAQAAGATAGTAAVNAALAPAVAMLTDPTYLIGCPNVGPFNARDDEDEALSGHFTARGAIWWGENIGRFRDALYGGTVRPVLRVLDQSVVRNATTVSLPLNREAVVDTSYFPDPGNLGVRLSTTGTATVRSARVEGATLTVELSAQPNFNSFIEVGYTAPNGGSIAPATNAASWTNGEVDLVGTPAKTAGSYSVIRAKDRAEASEYVPGLTYHDWLLAGRWQVA